MKTIKLNCKFGTNVPGDTIEVEDKVAATLVKDGNATEVSDEKKAKDSKEVIALKKKIATLEKEAVALKDKIKSLEEAPAATKDK